MKLIRLQLHKQYKSLEPFVQTFHPKSRVGVKIHPVCFAGINGSGKSHMIELLGEIFCYLELINLGYDSISQKALASNLRFTIEYEISLDRRQRHIKVVKKSATSSLFFEVKDEELIPIDSKQDCLKALPQRIIGYSSGMNEMLRFPFMKTQAHYSEDILKAARATEKKPVPHTRSLYMTYECNAAIVISNLLFFGPKKLKVFRDFLRIRQLDSFRITIQLKKRKKSVYTTPEIDEIIQKLLKCSTIHNQESEGRNYTLDYKVNDVTIKRFKKHFESAENLFVSLYKLYLLNPIRLDKKGRTFYKNIDTTEMGILQTPPEVAPEDRVFRIDQVELRISGPDMTIDYAGISDGEHQLLQVIGTILLFGNNECLFLLDEPETHLNPTWRTNFAAIVDKVTGKGKHEFVISTHSPFLVSECKSRNVLFFERLGKNKSKVKFREVDFETFGSSFDFLLCNLFDMKALIPERVLDEMKELVKSDNPEELKDGVMRFGESFEKRFIFQRIAELEKEGSNG